MSSRHFPGAERAATIAAMTTVTSTDGTAIAYERTGSGPPVVLVGGALSTRSSESGVGAFLAPGFTVYTYDRRGRGDSGDNEPYAVAREIEDLEAVLREAGGPVCVYGTSSSGNLVVQAAAAGLPIAKFAVWEPNFRVDDSRPPLPGDYVEHLQSLVRADRRGDAVEYFLTTAAGIPGEFVAAMRDLPMWPAWEAVAHTLAYDGAIVDGFELQPGRLASATAPALVLDGGQTPWLTAGANALADALPRAARRTLAGQQHNVAADAVAPVLAEFFRS